MKGEDKDFLSQNMSIDVDWLEDEFNSSDLAVSKQILEVFISNLVCSMSDENPKMRILEIFNAATPLDERTENYEILDSLRHAFKVYACGGLRDLFIYQSNESWYPKIVLKSELRPNDISDLPSSIDIYRGCDNSEFNSKKYRQSWSTSIQVAEAFAYENYASQSWYEEGNRCLLRARIEKEDVFFSRQNDHEKEVVVDIKKLTNVQKVKSSEFR